jgi:hypothetical protein
MDNKERLEQVIGNTLGNEGFAGMPVTYRKVADAIAAANLLAPEWISVTERPPTIGPEKTDNGPHIHCWCFVPGWGCEHLAWNPYYQCWDDADEDDHSRLDSRVTLYFVLPAAPKDNHDD